MPVNFKKELENAARNMIFVHDPDLLIKMIARMVVNQVKVEHASIFLYNPQRQDYLLTVSRGSLSKKIPVGLACMDKDDPLICFFRERKNKMFFNNDAVIRAEAEEFLKDNSLAEKPRQFLTHILHQMDLLDSSICVPSYFHKELLGILLLGPKSNKKQFSDQELDFFIALANHMSMAIRNAQLFKQLEAELDKKRQLFMRTTIALVAAIEAKDNYTHGHTTRVTSLSLQIAKRMNQRDKKICNAEFIEGLHIASLLHDVGKIGIPEHILNKRGSLTVGERNRIKEHPLIGATILKPIKELERSLEGIKYHHERYDGLGYPEGLKGESIPLIASIISVADSYDAMTSDRPYRTALYSNEAIKEIRNLRSRQFNPQVADTFIELAQEGKI